MGTNKEKPRWLILWRHNGVNYWEAVPDNKMDAFIEKLLLVDQVNPATIFMGMGMMMNWMFPSYHKELRSVWIKDIYEEINGTSNPSDYKGPDVEERPKEKKIKSKYGFVSPDGRYFQCEYEGHYTLAKEIVGSLEKVNNPQKHLEALGWLVIYRDPTHIGTYSVSMKYGKKITDEQLKTLQGIGLPDNINGLKEIL